MTKSEDGLIVFGFAEMLRHAASGPLMCARCGRDIDEDATHYIPVGTNRVLCECVTNGPTKKTHDGLWKDCLRSWHGVFDHPVGVAEGRGQAHEFLTVDVRDIKNGAWLTMVRFPEEVTAREVLLGGMCAPQCMLALGEDSGIDVTKCRCRCGGEWHGTLADTEVSPWFTPLMRRRGAP